MTTEQLADLLVTTQRKLGRMAWTSVALALQEYHALPKLLKKEKVGFESGTGLQKNIQVTDSGAAQHVEMWGDDSYGVADIMQTFFVPWRHTNTHYLVERREIAMNRTPSKIVDLVKLRRTDAMQSLARRMESTWWGKPADVSDVKTPFGVAYWIVKNATEGFYGGNPVGFPAGAAGIDSDIVTAWRNYSGTYAEFTRADFLRKIKRAARLCHFKSPVDHPTYKRGRDRHVFYAGLEVCEQAEIMAEDQNDNLGMDLDPANGAVRINKIPLMWVPFLDTDTSYPTYLIDWSEFRSVFLKGEYMHEDRPEKVPGKHTVLAVDVDTTWNTECTNRRHQGVLYKQAA